MICQVRRGKLQYFMISLNLHISLCIHTLFQCPVVSELNYINNKQNWNFQSCGGICYCVMVNRIFGFAVRTSDLTNRTVFSMSGSWKHVMTMKCMLLWKYIYCMEETTQRYNWIRSFSFTGHQTCTFWNNYFQWWNILPVCFYTGTNSVYITEYVITVVDLSVYFYFENRWDCQSLWWILLSYEHLLCYWVYRSYNHSSVKNIT